VKAAFRWVAPKSGPLDFLQLHCSRVQHLTREERPTEDTRTQWYRFDARGQTHSYTNSSTESASRGGRETRQVPHF